MEKEKKKKVLSSKEEANKYYNCIISVIIAVLFLFPIYWIVAMSFKSDAESFGKIVTYYPHEFTLDPWIKNFTDAEFLSSLKNSIFDCFTFNVIFYDIWCTSSLWNGTIQSTRRKRISFNIPCNSDASGFFNADTNVFDI